MKILIDEFKSAWKLYITMFLPTALFAVPAIVYKFLKPDAMTWAQATMPVWVPFVGLLMVSLGYLGISMVFGLVKGITSGK